MSSYKVLFGKNIKLSQFLQISKLDELVFDSKYNINLFKGLFWINKCKKGYIAILDNDTKKVVSYLSIISLTDKYYQIMKNGDIIDANLPLKSIKKFKKGMHQAYLSSVVIDPSINDKSILTLLLDSLVESLLDLENNGIYIKSVLADAVSDKGLKLCEMMDLERLNETSHNSIMYEASLIPCKLKPVTIKMRDYFIHLKEN